MSSMYTLPRCVPAAGHVVPADIMYKLASYHADKDVGLICCTAIITVACVISIDATYFPIFGLFPLFLVFRDEFRL